MKAALFSFPPVNLFLLKGETGLREVKYLKNKDDYSAYINSFGPDASSSPESFAQEIELFKEYFQGKPVDFKFLSLDLSRGTTFQKAVWKETRKIPYGKTSSYRELAKSLGHRGYRSIGQALGKNPFLIIVPCHRVLGADGSLGGFSAGLHLKKYLLGLEKTVPDK
ncbi:MAG: methylated-DNA--[protein]-cysteine S-methyltransferase [Acidobacteriota bacterium]